jgi:hypothetical protein
MNPDAADSELCAWRASTNGSTTSMPWRHELIDVVLVAVDLLIVLDHVAREIVVALGERRHHERDRR